MKKRISVIVPNYNGGLTIGICLDAVFSSDHKNFEVIVVDDLSSDNSVEIIQRYPCRLVLLDRRSGASKARNRGAEESAGDILFFIDADCVVHPDTLSLVNAAIEGNEGTVFGGTYTCLAYDDTFFSTFQSIFINYFETKRREPDYIASHSMIIDRKLFIESGGFPDDFLPIIEDVEFSHRLRRAGTGLVMEPDLQVRHIFNFNLLKSLQNAFRKSKYWNIYSMRNRDLLKDSGTASVELKINVASYFLMMILLVLSVFFSAESFLLFIPLIFLFNIYTNNKFLKAFFRTKGPLFGILSTLYYTMFYPMAVGAGSFAGMMKYYFGFRHT